MKLKELTPLISSRVEVLDEHDKFLGTIREVNSEVKELEVSDIFPGSNDYGDRWIYVTVWRENKCMQ